MFWLEFWLTLLSWPEACKAGLCPQVFGTFSFPSLLTEMWGGLAFHIHAEVTAFCDALCMMNLSQITVPNTLCCSFMMLFLKCH